MAGLTAVPKKISGGPGWVVEQLTQLGLTWLIEAPKPNSDVLRETILDILLRAPDTYTQADFCRMFKSKASSVEAALMRIETEGTALMQDPDTNRLSLYQDLLQEA